MCSHKNAQIIQLLHANYLIKYIFAVILFMLIKKQQEKVKF